MVGTAARRPLRADARRNYARILAAAEEAFATHGPDASLEEIARQAGVGSATLHRHFASRRSLLEAVFHDRVEALCARAREHARASEPGPALFAWLRDLNAYAAASLGLIASLLRDGRDLDLVEKDDDCVSMITNAAGELLDAARRAGAVRPGIRTEDMLALVNAISLATTEGRDRTDRTEGLDRADGHGDAESNGCADGSGGAGGQGGAEGSGDVGGQGDADGSEGDDAQAGRLLDIAIEGMRAHPCDTAPSNPPDLR
ncbi:helix-turn-helix domain-containing protein [Streptomyces sp. NPDC050610]|uniref:TetR/AcrR family transcriptional regulator n=1 Tax=Streptomyces sp. NPDC050610 TaxID=3157097 RepID=UPI00343217E4